MNAWIAGSRSLYVWLAGRTGYSPSNADVSQRIEGRVRAWRPRFPGQPQFVWIHYTSPHDPYASVAPWLGSINPSPNATAAEDSTPRWLFADARTSPDRVALLKDRYDESIREVDFHVGRAIETLKETLGQNTAFIITADHGESFGHGYGAHMGPMLYEDLVHIPLILHLPKDERAGTRLSAPASQIDLAPTIATIAGMVPDPSWEGRSLLSSEPMAEDRTVYAMNFEENPARGQLKTGSIALIRNHWKLVRFFGNLQYPDMPKLKTQLFDLRADPSEVRNLAPEHPDIVGELSMIMDAEFAKHSDRVTSDDRTSTR
jgi:arylsulfatase A-like enzyme